MSLLFLFRTLLSLLLVKGFLFLFFLLFGLRFGGSDSFCVRVSSSPSLCLFTLPCFFLLSHLFLGFRSPSSLLLLLRQSQGLSLAGSFSIGGALLGFRTPDLFLSALNHPMAPSFYTLSLETNEKLAVAEPLCAAGVEVSVVSGGTVSTVHPRCAGVASTLPTESIARTANWCWPLFVATTV